MNNQFRYFKYKSQDYIRDGDYAGHWEDTDIDGEDRLYYGDLEENASGDLMEIPYTIYSDYSGSTVERSNCDVFLERYGKRPDVWETYGGFSTRGAVMRRMVYDDPQTDEEEEIKECIDSLFNYPVIDEERMSNLEFELEEESWNDYGRSDLRYALKKAGIYTDEEMDDISDESLDQMWYVTCDVEAIYPIFEDANGPYFYIDDAVKAWNKDVLKDKEDNNG
jgi:hypothetical protein